MTTRDMHSDRQMAYLDEALRWISQADLSDGVARALRLAVSTTITSNNRLCGYARDYGRLSPLFSVRAFALPWLTVELNPLNPAGGRGTLPAALARVAQSCDDQVRRNVLDSRRQAVPATLTLTRVRDGHQVTCQDAAAEPTAQDPGEPLADVCITDPPYFDFISYDTLSQVFRAWMTGPALSGTPLLPAGADPVTAFGRGLGAALRSAAARSKPDALIAFTYKGDAEAWDAVAFALDEAKLKVTALWPVLADPHMGHHTHEGNCEYDVLVVARPITAVTPTAAPNADSPLHPDTMLRRLRRDRRVSKADETNLRCAAAMADERWGRPAAM